MLNVTNLTNFTPHYEAHRSYVIEQDYVHCGFLMDLAYNERCAFIREHNECNELRWYINWTAFMFCELDLNATKFGVMALILIMVICVLILTEVLVAYCRFTPSFLAVAQYMRFNEHNAGSVLLVFATYMPDVFENHFLYDLDTLTYFNESLGAALAATLFYAGFLMICYPCVLHTPFIIRDSIFMIIGFLFLTVFYIQQRITFWVGLSFALFYVLYLIYVSMESIINWVIYKREFSKDGKEFDYNDVKPEHRPINIDYMENQESQYGELDSANQYIFRQFFSSLHPIRKEIFSEMELFYKILFLIGLPIYQCIIILIPCYNVQLPGHGWSKLLICIQLIITGPVTTALFTNSYKWILSAFVPGILLAIIVFFTSRTDRPPKYHIFFAYHSLYVCMVFAFVFEHEIINIFYLLGIFMRMRRQFTGVTFLAWMDCIIIGVWGFRFAGWGYPKMAFMAMYVGPMVGILFKIPFFKYVIFSFGMIFIKKQHDDFDNTVKTHFGELGPSVALYVIIGYSYVVFGILLEKSQLRKWLGISMICVYLCFLYHCFMVEYDVIHGKGTEHSYFSDTGETWA